MKTLPLSLLSQLSAGALLSQSMIPAVLPFKEKYDADRAREAAVSAALAKAALSPPPMKGVPLMKVGRAVPPTSHAFVTRAPLGPGRTMLDEETRLRRNVTSAEAMSWRAELARGGTKTREARLLVRLGELALAGREPVSAQSMFDRAASLLPESAPDRGLARFDAALALYREGRYAAARLAFRHVAAAPLTGVNRRLATLYARHAAACEGYHREREALDIPEPPFTDPLCGVASLAVCLRGRGMTYAKADVLGKVDHDGEGSDIAQLEAALPRIGLSGRQVRADERGLRLLPKPLVAHVEHDHFVAVVAADKQGVEYVCSDCGAWPGGPVRLTWTQWRMMEADRYLAVAKPGTPEALALRNLPATAGPGHVAMASTAPQSAGLVAGAERILAALGASVVAQGSTIGDPDFYGCGMAGLSLHCVPCTNDEAGFASGTHFSFSSDDPVNLASAEEEYTLRDGLRVYNPTGPSVSWSPSYVSLADTTPNGFGLGWTHPYNLRIEDFSNGNGNPTEPTEYQPGKGPQPPGGPGGQTNGVQGGGQTNGGVEPPPYNPTAVTRSTALVLPNSARVGFTPPATLPTASAPVQHCAVQAGYPVLIDFCWNATTSSRYYVATFPDRSRWTFTLGGTDLYYPTQIADRAGNWIGLNWATFAFQTMDSFTLGYHAPGLTSIVDSSGQALLTLGYDANARMVSASDRYGRSVYYTIGHNANTDVYGEWPLSSDGITQVSQVVATGTTNPPVRAQYGYASYGNEEHGSDGAMETIPYLHTIAVPSPTGSGMSTATVDYSSIGEVSDSYDANGNHTVYSPITVSGTVQADATRVQVYSSGGTLAYQRDVYFDSRMSKTKVVNAQGQTVATWAYADPNTPFAASSVTDGNGLAWSMTHDAFGHLLTSVSPKNVTTRYVYAYGQFALGEIQSAQEGSKTATSYSYYEPSGLLQEVDAPVPGGVGTGSTQATTYAYTAMGQLASVTEPGSAPGATRTTAYGYTADGSYAQAEALGEPLTVTDALGKAWHRRYDARGNLTSAWDPLGNETDVALNLANQVVTSLAPATGNTGSGRASETTTYLYVGGPATQLAASDESGNVVRTVSVTYGPEGEPLSRTGSAEEVHLAYDAAYATKTLKDGNGNATSYAYDLSGRPTEIDYPLASGTDADRVLFTSYGPVGNLLSRTDGNGQVTNYAYADADGRLSSVSYPGADASDVSLSYDAYDRTTSVTDGAGVETTGYDDLDETLSTTTTYAGLPAVTLSYGYEPDGARASLTLPNDAWTYGYDADGRYASMVSTAGTSSATYFDNGWESSRTLPNGVVTGYAYDAVGDLTAQSSPYLAGYGSFSYDGAFNETGFAANTPWAPSQSGSTTYGYDAKDRLTSESSTRLGGYAQANAYDAAGNPTTLRGVSQAFDADSRLTGGAFAYDGNGSPTTYNGAGMAYDPEARATGLPGGATAGYRSDGLRAWKASGGTTTYFYYDADGDPVLETDGAGNVTAENVVAPDGLVARETASSHRVKGGQTSGTYVRVGETQYAFDPEGNVAQRLDSAGDVQSSSVYDAYGEESCTTAPSDPFGYHARDGYYQDRETGLAYCQNRYYDPGAGRWVTRDPIGTDGGINVYGYCASGPVGASDPSGLIPLIGGGGVHGDEEGGLDGFVGGIGLGDGGGGGGGGYVPEPAPESEPAPNRAFGPEDYPRVEKLPPERIKERPSKPGNAPLGDDGCKTEIHHGPDGTLKQMTKTDHRLNGNFKLNHPEGTGADGPADHGPAWKKFVRGWNKWAYWDNDDDE